MEISNQFADNLTIIVTESLMKRVSKTVIFGTNILRENLLCCTTPPKSSTHFTSLVQICSKSPPHRLNSVTSSSPPVSVSWSSSFVFYFVTNNNLPTQHTSLLFLTFSNLFTRSHPLLCRPTIKKPPPHQWQHHQPAETLHFYHLGSPYSTLRFVTCPM